MKSYLLIALLGIAGMTSAQTNTLPVKTMASNDKSKPLVFYATGDGGFTRFSNGFMESLNKAGYPVVALNSKDYFWKKKTPSQTAADAAQLLRAYMGVWKRDSVILIGYSFGADVTPFIQNYMENNLSAKTSHIVLMLPYQSTDFEVHLTEMIGISHKDSWSVPDEINKVKKPILFVLGTDKSQFPLSSLHIPHYQSIRIDGGHHFDDNADQVTAQVLSFLH